jgi:acyl-CoA reductase-like NAD-dependent aldehyde dehydrogenase
LNEGKVKTIKTINPATEEVLNEYKIMTKEQINDKVKKSGFGRELSRYGMLEFVNIKSVRFYDQLIHNHYVE